MINYQLGKIYKIVDNVTGKIYIGSTCKPTLARRLAKHISGYKYYLKSNNKYTTSFKILENDDYSIVLLENGLVIVKMSCFKENGFILNPLNV